MYMCVCMCVRYITVKPFKMCQIIKYKTKNTFLLKKLYFAMLNNFFKLMYINIAEKRD